MGSKHLPRREKTIGGLEKSPCKLMKQGENEQNYEKGSTLVVGKNPNGKSQFDVL
jgi:hypothetical protein